MIYPLIDFPPEMGERAMEALLMRSSRVLTGRDGEPHKITCFAVIWRKFDFLTSVELFGAKASTASELLQPALDYERRRPYDLDISFATQVAMVYENVRLAVVENQSGVP